MTGTNEYANLISGIGELSTVPWNVIRIQDGTTVISQGDEPIFYGDMLEQMRGFRNQWLSDKKAAMNEQDSFSAESGLLTQGGDHVHTYALPAHLGITTQDVLEVLKEALALDGPSMQKLIDHRVQCNEALANHPTIVCRDDGADKVEVGIIGLLNGVLAKYGQEKIAAVYESLNDSPEILIDFEVYKPDAVL